METELCQLAACQLVNPQLATVLSLGLRYRNSKRWNTSHSLGHRFQMESLYISALCDKYIHSPVFLVF